MNPRWLTLIALTVLGGCEYWYTVTVPTSDSTPPTAWATLYYDGGHQVAATSSGTSFSKNWTDPYKSFFIVGSGTDSGGTHRVDLSVSTGHFCTKGSVAKAIGPGLVVPLTEIQPGSPGSKVDNGLYGAKYYRFSDFSNPCGSGWTWVSTTAYITTRAEDFHGNVSTVSSTVRHSW